MIHVQNSQLKHFMVKKTVIEFLKMEVYRIDVLGMDFMPLKRECERFTFLVIACHSFFEAMFSSVSCFMFGRRRAEMRSKNNIVHETISFALVTQSQ